MDAGLHHQHLRKRLYRNLEAFPHPNATKRILDKVIFLVGALGPLSTIPQVYVIYATRDASGVSALSWFMYLIFSVIWVIYGVVHREKAIIFTYSLWILMNSLVAYGAILY